MKESEEVGPCHRHVTASPDLQRTSQDALQVQLPAGRLPSLGLPSRRPLSLSRDQLSAALLTSAPRPWPDVVGNGRRCFGAWTTGCYLVMVSWTEVGDGK